MTSKGDTVCIVPLTRNKYALISPEDYDCVSAHRWHASVRSRSDGTSFWYAVGRVDGKRTYLHSFVTGFARVDHINGDGLDNSRKNLRDVSHTQNCANQRKHWDGISKFKGVSIHQNTRKWRAYIFFEGKQIHLGYFEKDTDAARAYDEAARRIHGKFARTNADLGLLP